MRGWWGGGSEREVDIHTLQHQRGGGYITCVQRASQRSNRLWLRERRCALNVYEEGGPTN